MGLREMLSVHLAPSRGRTRGGEGNGRGGGTTSRSTFHIACSSGPATTNPPRSALGGSVSFSARRRPSPPFGPPGRYIQCLSAVSMAQRGRGAAGPVLKQWQCKSTLDLKWNCAVRFGILSRRNAPFPLFSHSLKTSCCVCFLMWVFLSSELKSEQK